MEKSAHPAALATRLNNLEQKFEEENALDMKELLAIIAKLFQLTLYRTEKDTGEGLSDDWYKNPNIFDGNFSLAMSVYGDGIENFQIYEAQKTLNFYNRVFGSAVIFDNFDGVLPLSHALFMNVGKAFTSEWNEKSLTETIFGNDANITLLHDEGSLFDKIFGNNAEYLQNEGSLLEFILDNFGKILGNGADYLQNESFFRKVFGSTLNIDAYLDEISGTVTRSDFLSAVQRFRRDFDTYKTNVDNKLESLSQRISNLE